MTQERNGGSLLKESLRTIETQARLAVGLGILSVSILAKGMKPVHGENGDEGEPEKTVEVKAPKGDPPPQKQNGEKHEPG